MMPILVSKQFPKMATQRARSKSLASHMNCLVIATILQVKETFGLFQKLSPILHLSNFEKD
jgi:hypothetical protein